MRKKKILPLRCQNWMEKPGVERKKEKKSIGRMKQRLNHFLWPRDVNKLIGRGG